MQGDVERGVFNPRKYYHGDSNVVQFLREWLDECKGDWSPGTYKNYLGYVNNHLEPFFIKYQYQLHEVKLKVIKQLKNELDKKEITPNTRKKVIDSLSSAMDYAWRSELIDSLPFPLSDENIKLLIQYQRLLQKKSRLKLLKLLKQNISRSSGCLNIILR